jgi:uncharacterized protein YrrD
MEMTTPNVHGLALTDAGVIHLHRDRVRLRGVCVAGVNVGAIVDIVLDSERRRVAGFAVRLTGGEARFVPLGAVAALGPCGIELESTLHLVETIAFYAASGARLSALLGATVSCRHSAPVAITDVVADLANGEIVAVELADGRTLVRESLAEVSGGFRVACTCAERDPARRLIA